MLHTYTQTHTPIYPNVAQVMQWRNQDLPSRGPRGGAWTPEAATFRKICMSK